MTEPMDRLRQICMSFPEAEERSFGGHTAPAFRVRDKLFVMTPEAGDPWFMCKGAPGAQAVLVGSSPDRFFIPAYTGKNGWIGVRIDGAVDWDEVAGLVSESYRLIAPKRLAALVSR